MRKTLFILLAVVAACASPPTAVRTGLPGRGALVDTPDRPVAFRVLVYSSERKTDAERVTREVHLFQNLPVRLVHDDPYWRVIVGDFERKLRAAEVRTEMSGLGYGDARIIPLFKKDGNGS